MTDEKLASPDWPPGRDSQQHWVAGRVVQAREGHRKRSSRFNCVRATAATLFYLLFHSQIIPSNQQELLRQPTVGVSGVHQLVRYDGAGSSTRAAKQITRRSYNTGQPSGGQSPDAPKLIPLSALDRYQEGTDLRLFCSASAPKSAGRLYFEWRKNQNELLASSSTTTTSSTFSGAPLDSDEITGPAHGAATSSSSSAGANKPRLQISMMDESASVLRISSLEASDAGNYTCLVRNQQGFDSSTVRVNILVKMKWIVEPPSDVPVRAGKLVQLECDASGQPAPLISWTSLKDHRTINSKLLRIDRVSTNDSGMYECRATRAVAVNSGGQHRDHGSEQLRKLVRLIVNGKC